MIAFWEVMFHCFRIYGRCVRRQDSGNYADAVLRYQSYSPRRGQLPDNLEGARSLGSLSSGWFEERVGKHRIIIQRHGEMWKKHDTEGVFREYRPLG